jgi:hypothetical protein
MQNRDSFPAISTAEATEIAGILEMDSP